jgi:hypothetical protein
MTTTENDEGAQDRSSTAVCVRVCVLYLPQIEPMHAILHGLPVAQLADGLQHRRRLVEGSSVLDALDGMNALQVHEFRSLGPDQQCVVYVCRGDVRVLEQLAGAPDEDEAVVIVQAPHTCVS